MVFFTFILIFPASVEINIQEAVGDGEFLVQFIGFRRQPFFS